MRGRALLLAAMTDAIVTRFCSRRPRFSGHDDSMERGIVVRVNGIRNHRQRSHSTLPRSLARMVRTARGGEAEDGKVAPHCSPDRSPSPAPEGIAMRNPKRSSRFTFLAAIVVACAGAYAAQPSRDGVDAPQLRPGDKWTYRVVEGYRRKSTWTETHEVKSVVPGSLTVAVTAEGPKEPVTREEVWSAPGVVRSGTIAGFDTKRFEPPLIRYRFPLTRRATWSQRVRDVDKPAGPYGGISFKASVVGHETISTPAGKFDTVKIRYVYQLDDESLSNYATQCEYVVWYSAAVGSAVQEQRRAWAATKGVSSVRTPAETGVYELTGITRGQ
jgi:hypothetical protein